MDPKNVLWSVAGEPWIVDWESAGLVHPSKEIVTAALDWSEHGADLETFQSVLQSYRAHADLSSDDVRHGLHAYFDWLGWLEFNAQRALGTVTANAAERELGTKEVWNTLRALQGFAGRLSRLTSLC